MNIANKKVIVIGGGFGGIGVAKALRGFDVTLINTENYFLFTPLLHEVATGNLAPANIIEPITEIFARKHVHFIKGEAKNVDTKRQVVELAQTSEILHYDYLVIAVGSKSRFLTPGSEKFTLGLKTLDDAIKIKNKVISLFEQASQIKNPDAQRKLLSFVIVGGGPTALEFVTELEEFIYRTLVKHFKSSIAQENITITLVSSGNELLQQFNPAIRKYAHKTLSKKKIKVFFNQQVTLVNKNSVESVNGQSHESACTIWLSGVSPCALDFSEKVLTSQSGRMVVNKFLQIETQKNIFALGDMANFVQNNFPLPMLAQVASKQADIVVKNIFNLEKKLPLVPFIYHSQGELVSLGKFNAVGRIMGLRIAGVFAWWIWRTVYLVKFPSWKKRICIAYEWTLNLFTPRDITKETTATK